MTLPGIGASGPQGSRGRGDEDEIMKQLKAEFEAEMQARSVFMQLDDSGDGIINKDDEDKIGTSALSALQKAAGSETITFDKFKKLFTKEGFQEFVSGLIANRKAELRAPAQNNETIYKSFEEAKAAAKKQAGPDIGGGSGTAKYVDSEGYQHQVTYWWEVIQSGDGGSSTTGRCSDMKLGK